MASLLENLIDVLDKENAEYEKLIVLAEDKTPTIIKGDVESLSKRIKVLADVANVVNRDVETLKLIDLIQMLEKMPDQQKRLKDIHGSLKKTTEKLREINDKNQLLLADKLDMVEFNLNMIRAMKSAPQTANYSRDAYTNGEVLGIFHGGFDAKQ